MSAPMYPTMPVGQVQQARPGVVPVVVTTMQPGMPMATMQPGMPMATGMPMMAPMGGMPMGGQMMAPGYGGYYGRKRMYKTQKKMMKRARKQRKKSYKYGYAGGAGYGYGTPYAGAAGGGMYQQHQRYRGQRNVSKGIRSLNPKKIVKGLGQQHRANHPRRYY